MAARIRSTLVIIGLVASTGTMAQNAKLSDFATFAGHWRPDQEASCQHSLATNIVVRPREIIYQYNNIGVVICSVRNFRPAPNTPREYIFNCNYVFADGKEDVASDNVFSPISANKIRFWSKGGLHGVYAKCPKPRD